MKKYWIPYTEKDMFILSIAMIVVGILMIIVGIQLGILGFPILIYGLACIGCFCLIAKNCVYKKEKPFNSKNGDMK